MSTQPYKKVIIEGQKFGGLTFLNRVPALVKGESPKANFKCTCGNEFITRIHAVEIGKAKSCGCLRPKVISQPKNVYNKGEKIGELIFLNRVTPKKNGDSPLGNFLCICGKEFVCRIHNVINLVTKSCGCKKSELNKIASTKHKPVEYIENGVKAMPHFTEEMFNRFWSKVGFTSISARCWNWQNGTARYGDFRVGKAMYKANRVAYFLHYKKDPLDFEVMHSCDNPRCCNPAHLSLGTHFENMQDMAEKGRANNGK